jgi:hypothetical protein
MIGFSGEMGKGLPQTRAECRRRYDRELARMVAAANATTPPSSVRPAARNRSTKRYETCMRRMNITTRDNWREAYPALDDEPTEEEVPLETMLEAPQKPFTVTPTMLAIAVGAAFALSRLS